MRRDVCFTLRIESWANFASHLRRFVKLFPGSKIACDLIRQGIAQLSNDILEGKYDKVSYGSH